LRFTEKGFYACAALVACRQDYPISVILKTLGRQVY